MSAQAQQGKAAILSQAEQYAQQSGLPSANAVLLSSGIPPQLLDDLGKYQAQEIELALKANGGKLPTTQAEDNTVTAALTKSSCLAAKSLNIQINPQYGRLDYSQYTVVPVSTVRECPSPSSQIESRLTTLNVSRSPACCFPRVLANRPFAPSRSARCSTSAAPSRQPANPLG